MQRLAAICLILFASVAIGRDQKAVKEFRANNPCPATKIAAGACPGYVVDHVKPLCAGGLDRPSNMQWQAYRQSKEKDKIEIAFCNCMSRRLKVCNGN